MMCQGDRFKEKREARKQTFWIKCNLTMKYEITAIL